MPGHTLDPSAVVMCAHGGPARAVPTQPRVKVMGQPVLLQTDVTTVTGCAFSLPAGPSPCVMVQWLTGSVRTRVMAQPVLLSASQGLCIGPVGPQGPASIVVTQVRVRAT